MFKGITLTSLKKYNEIFIKKEHIILRKALGFSISQIAANDAIHIMAITPFVGYQALQLFNHRLRIARFCQPLCRYTRPRIGEIYTRLFKFPISAPYHRIETLKRSISCYQETSRYRLQLRARASCC